MSPAAAPIDRSHPTASQLLDVLYEMIASGIEPEGSTASSGDIEAFLHQHARAPKSRGEIDAFFQSHRLPQQLEGLSRESGLRLAPLAPTSPAAVMPPPVPAAGQVAPPAVAVETGAVTVAVPTALPQLRLWIALGLVVLAFMVASVVGGFALMTLREDVARSNANQRALLLALDGLKQRTQQTDTRIEAQAQALKSTHEEISRLVESFFPVTE